MNRDTLQTLAGCGVALALGFFAGRLRSPSADPARPAEIVAQFSPVTDAQRTADETFSKAIRDETGAQRWMTLLSAAENATAADLPRLIRIADKDEPMLRMLAARWAELDPKHMLHTLYADALLPVGVPERLPGDAILRDVLLEEWTKSDLAGAIAALNDVPDFPTRHLFRQKLANAAALDSDVERGLGLMSEWKVGLYSDLGKISAWIARDPRHAAEAALTLRGADGLLKEAGKAWAARDPAAGLQFAAGLAPGARANLGGEVIARWAERDLAAAVAYSEAQPDAMRAALAAGLVATWGKSDPAAALAWSQQNLKGGTRTEVIGNLVTAFAEKDLAAAGGLVASMEPGAAQNRATMAIVETWIKKGASEREAAFEWLAGVPDAEARRVTIEKVAWTWAVGDPAAARDFLAGPHGGMASPNTVRLVASIQAGTNPEATMAWANTLPADRRETARNAALDRWLQSRPEGATAFARALSAGPERARAIETVSQSLAYQSPELAAKWVRELPSSEQQTAREIFERADLTDEKREQLNKALEKL